MLAIRLPIEIEERLTYLAKVTGRTKTFYAREAITEHLDDLEDCYLASKTLEEIKNNKQTTISIDELEKELGLED